MADERTVAVQTQATLGADTRAALEYDAAKKSVLIAYILWFFLSSLGAHRFYLGRTMSALAMIAVFGVSLILTFVVIGAFGLFVLGAWVIVDAFLIPGMTRSYNQALIARIESGLVG